MDSGAQDNVNAVEDLEKKTAEELIAEQPISTNDVVGEKKALESNSSTSFSDDSRQIDKLDSRVVNVKDVKDGDDAYAHLPEHERAIIKRQLDLPNVTVTFKTLYRYATRNDLIIIVISIIAAIIGGAAMPLMTVGSHSYPETCCADPLPTDSFWWADWHIFRLLQPTP